MPETPESCKPHQGDYKPHAWEAYSFDQLGMWVHLLAMRAGHREPGSKQVKDFKDASNYLDMMRSKLDALAIRTIGRKP